MQRDKLLHADCMLSTAMSALGSKWKPIIVMVLQTKKMRFGQLAAMINIISRKVLTDQLRELEEDGILERAEFREVPPRVEYHLTEKGLALLPILKQLAAWEKEYPKIKAD
jgi:DNA-binding HxlR family transcriptional regulator